MVGRRHCEVCQVRALASRVVVDARQFAASSEEFADAFVFAYTHTAKLLLVYLTKVGSK